MQEEGVPTNWGVAEYNCTLEGGHLASVPDMETNNFIASLIDKSGYGTAGEVWIGAQNTGDGLAWVDNTEWGFTNWAGGHAMPGTGCLFMEQDRQWSKMPCLANNIPYVCCKHA